MESCKVCSDKINKRKSIGRNRSRTLDGFASKNLCEAIPNSKPQSERLLMLFEKAFQHALSVAEEKVLSKNDYDISTFTRKKEECWEKTRVIIEGKNLHKSATEKNELCETYTEAKVEKLNEDIALIEKESEKWVDQVMYYRESLKNEMEAVYSIDAAEVAKKYPVYDYSNVMEQPSVLEKKIFYALENISSVNEQIKSCLDISESLEANLRKNYENYFHQEVSSSPRTIIRRLASPRRKPY